LLEGYNNAIKLISEFDLVESERKMFKKVLRDYTNLIKDIDKYVLTDFTYVKNRIEKRDFRKPSEEVLKKELYAKSVDDCEVIMMDIEGIYDHISSKQVNLYPRMIAAITISSVTGLLVRNIIGSYLSAGLSTIVSIGGVAYLYFSTPSFKTYTLKELKNDPEITKNQKLNEKDIKEINFMQKMIDYLNQIKIITTFLKNHLNNIRNQLLLVFKEFAKLVDDSNEYESFYTSVHTELEVLSKVILDSYRAVSLATSKLNLLE